MNNTIGFEEISLDGYQIVASDMFYHLPKKSDATCTIWPTSISFSKLALQMLNNCEYIRLEVNPTAKRLVVIPTTSSDKNGIRWVKGQSDFQVRRMESRRFGDELYKSWNLDPKLNYRSIGRIVSSNKKVMMLFDFSNPEVWTGTKEGA